MKIPTLAKLLEDQLKDLYSAETQLTKALPKMAKKASFDGLKQAILAHLEETKQQVERLKETLDEESAADEKLSSISLEEILPNAEVADQAEV
jgi:ferritin-like metal-binding protein YciE